MLKRWTLVSSLDVQKDELQRTGILGEEAP